MKKWERVGENIIKHTKLSNELRFFRKLKQRLALETLEYSLTMNVFVSTV